MRRMTLLSIFTNLFNARFNQDNLDSQTYLCIQSVVIITHHVASGKLHCTVSCERMSKVKVVSWYYGENSFPLYKTP